jgi:23S rRNA pseudouridine2605 synthase
MRQDHTAGKNYKRSDSATSKGKNFRKKKKVEPVAAAPKSDQTRLNKYLAASGICSRREADELISAGLVSINGNIVTELGTKVNPGDQVKYNGERLRSERMVYMIMNKPKDYITTLRDPHAKKTVFDLLGKACKERIFPVGRLDKNTTGVLLFTNDGDLTKKLTHPQFNKMKIYHVSLDRSLKGADLKEIQDGIVLEDGPMKVDNISFTDATDKSKVGIEIHSGKNRVVRRIFEHLGYKVRKLDRVYFAGLTKKGLARGKWRFLTDTEIAMLKMGSFK